MNTEKRKKQEDKGNLFKFMRLSKGLTRKDAKKLLGFKYDSKIQHLEEGNNPSYDLAPVYEAYGYDKDFKVSRVKVVRVVKRFQKLNDKLGAFKVKKQVGGKSHFYQQSIEFLNSYLESLQITKS